MSVRRGGRLLPGCGAAVGRPSGDHAILGDGGVIGGGGVNWDVVDALLGSDPERVDGWDEPLDCRGGGTPTAGEEMLADV